MALPFAARQHFLEKGYAIVRGVIHPATIKKLREGSLAATFARPAAFRELPTLESIFQSQSKYSVEKAHKELRVRLQKRQCVIQHFKQFMGQKRKLAKIMRSHLNGRDAALLTGEELWEFSKKLAKELTHLSTTEENTETVKSDPQMLASINEYRANAWMTNSLLGDTLRSDDVLKGSLAMLAEIVGGVEKPVVFGDAPLLRESFGGPIGYRFTAPSIGVRTNAIGRTSAVTLVPFTFTSSAQKLPLFVLKNSHRFVSKQYIHEVPPSFFSSQSFLPLESHVAHQLRQFRFNQSVVGKLADNTGTIPSGSVLIADPHLLFGFGSNLTRDSEVVYQLNVICKDAMPYLEAPSWIRGWRSLPQEVRFASSIVFPPLVA